MKEEYASLHFLHIIRVSFVPFRGDRTTTSGFLITSERLGEFRPLSDDGAFPVKNKDWDGDKEGENSKDGGGNFKFMFDVEAVKWCRVHGSDTGEKIPCQGVAASG